MDFYRKQFLTQLSKCSVKNLMCVFITTFFCVFIHICLMHDILRFANNVSMILNFAGHRDAAPPKYILTWDPYYLITTEIFDSMKCPASNCIFSSDRTLLKDYTNYDAIIFNDKHLISGKPRPERRLSSQIYIYATIESPVNSPACNTVEDNFYNWTFTYRLDSNIVWPFFVVRNISGNVVAPKPDVKWVYINTTIDSSISTLFKERKRAAAWLVSNCNPFSPREEYLTKLREHLFQYELTIDVYGACSKPCENNNCEEMLRKNYYFYMAFENSMAEDYVTEKVLHGYDNYVVPIVFGGANYSRFLPPGSYINALEHHPYTVAQMMNRAISNPSIYEGFFNWTIYYTISNQSYMNQFRPLCDLCGAMQTSRLYYAPANKNFRLWWNGLNGMKWCLSQEFWNDTAKLNIDGTSVYNSYVCVLF